MNDSEMRLLIQHLGLTAELFAQLIDNTVLDTKMTVQDVHDFCRTSSIRGFGAVAVHSCMTAVAKKAVHGSASKVCSAIGFPFGAVSIFCKTAEIRDAAASGADELDFVTNIHMVKSGDWKYIERETREIVQACGGRTVKMILETSLLTEHEKKRLCDISAGEGVDYIKTCTGFQGGTNLEEILMLSRYAGTRCRIKATGGIRNLSFALELIQAGAQRIGTSSGLSMLEEFEHLVS